VRERRGSAGERPRAGRAGLAAKRLRCLTISLADVLIRDDYAYFEKLYETGYISIQNHMVTHPLAMPSLPASRQLYEISGQQESSGRSTG
jgi:hypothetical protein